MAIPREFFRTFAQSPNRLQKTLSPAQEGVVVALRQVLLLPLDDLFVVTREFIHADGPGWASIAVCAVTVFPI